MNRQKQLVQSTNRGFGDLGDTRAPHGTSTRIEDRLIEVLDDCINSPNLSLRSCNIRHFREFLRHYGAEAGFDHPTIEQCKVNDGACEFLLHYTCAGLARMAHCHEWSINWLLSQGMPIEDIPDGKSFLGK